MMRALLYIVLSVSLCLSVAVTAQQQTDQEASAASSDGPPGSAEQAVESNPPEEPGDEDTSDENTSDENTSDKDFKPSEEISEDYPVPLPSDI